MNAYYGDRYEAYSAGTEPSNVNPYAVAVMAEIAIDISSHRAKHVEEFQSIQFDYVVTVCDSVKETCPFFPGAKEQIHKGFEDPSQFEGSEDEKLAVFRRTRDDIKDWIEKTFGDALKGSQDTLEQDENKKGK